MSGANVVKFPERQIKPDTEACIGIVAGCNNDPGELFQIARLSLNAIERLEDMSEQGVINGILIAYLALGEVLDGANEGDDPNPAA
jgi:hypothetical protein